MFVCQKCDRCFSNKSNYNRHLKRKNPCKKKKIDPKQYETIDFPCEYCQNDFTTKQNLNRHKKNTNTACYITRTMKQEMQALKEAILSNPPSTTNNITNVTNVTNNVTNNNIINVQIVAPGKENMDHITVETVLDLMNHDFSHMMSELMRLIYFNKDVPENNHWCVKYTKSEYGVLQFNTDTQLIERLLTPKIINLHFDNMMELLAPIVNKITPAMIESRQQKVNLSLFYEYYGVSDLQEEKPHDYHDLKMMAFNNKVVPVEHWKIKGLKGV